MFFRSKKHNIKESSLNVSMCPMEAWTDCLIRPCRKGQETYAKQKYWYRVIQTRSYCVGRDRRQQGPLQAIKSMCWVSQKWFMGGTLNPCRHSLSWQWLKCEEMIEHTNKRQSDLYDKVFQFFRPESWKVHYWQFGLCSIPTESSTVTYLTQAP